MVAPIAKDPLEAVLKESAKLPSLPEVLLRLDKELGRDDVDFGKVGSLVGMDPVLSGQILRMANSAWYSRGGAAVQDLPRALIRLGVPTTRQLVHALVMPALFPKTRSSIDLDAFWRHSFAVALFAQAIGRRMKLGRSELEVLWTAGLLHDIGALVFDLSAHEVYSKILKICAAEGVGESEPIDFCAVEKDWLGFDHAMMGASFLEKFWKLPSGIVWCVRYHEDLAWALEEPDAVKSIVPIHVAVSVCDERGFGWLPERARFHKPIDHAWAKLGIEDSAMEEMNLEVERALEQATAMLHRG